MQLFLLMILSAFMGGYYYLGSPALNIGHDFLPESVRTKTLIMCVINEHKKALDDNSKNLRGNDFEFEKTSPCAKSKEIITKKFCMVEDTISPNCYLQEGEGENASYLAEHYFTTFVDIPKNLSQSKILDFVKTMSGGLPNLGILFKTENEEFVILNPQTMTDSVSIKNPLIGANSLRKGQLIYFSHHSTSEVEAIAENSDWEALECENTSDIKVFDGETQSWACRPFESFKKCFGDSIENEKGDCIPNQNKKVSCPVDQRSSFNYDASAWECKRRISISCTPEETLAWIITPSPGKYICVNNEEFDDSSCEDLVKNPATGEWETVRLGGTSGGYPCGPCEIHKSGGCDENCFPDPASVSENLCAGANCGYDEGGWKTDSDDCDADENGVIGNCARNKAIYWKNSINRWKCVDCYPLPVKSSEELGINYQTCLNATIRTEDSISSASCSHTNNNYTTIETDDGCYLTTDDNGEDFLNCSFVNGEGEFGVNGEKGFFCDLDGINDQKVCSNLGHSNWAWYDYSSGGVGTCYDPYDENDILQALPEGELALDDLAIYEGSYSFGCPSGYERFREENDQISECKNKFCDIAIPRLNIAQDGCKSGYVEILNDSDSEKCFYCWIPEENFTLPTITQQSSDFFPAQNISKNAQIFEANENGGDTFEYYTACERSLGECDEDNIGDFSCFKNPVNNYCLDTIKAHNSPPGWKRTWSETEGEWSDAIPDWCSENNYPEEGVEADAETCPLSYQTKLLGSEINNILSACLYCLPEPYEANEIAILFDDPLTTPPNITSPQQPGAWQIQNCIEGAPESVKNDQPELDPYVGTNFAYSENFCELASNTDNCANGLERAWNGSWGGCDIIWCEGRETDIDRTGAYIPILKTTDAGYCLYMWRPPYAGTPPYSIGDNFTDWTAYYYKNINWSVASINYANDKNGDGDIEELSYEQLDGFYVDATNPNFEKGYVQNWTDDDIGWKVTTNWCPEETRTEIEFPDAIFPKTGWLNEIPTTHCFNEAQPTLNIWNSCDTDECHKGDTECFNSCLHTSCIGGGCYLTEEPEEYLTNKPVKSTWSSVLGWSDLVVEECEPNNIPPVSNYYFYLKKLKEDSSGNYCADVWKPEYEKWSDCIEEGCHFYSPFDISVDDFYECQGEECDDPVTEDYSVVPNTETGNNTTHCFRNISSRYWLDEEGWSNDCSLNYCDGSTMHDTEFLLKAIEDTRPSPDIPNCGENTKPAPHKVLAEECISDGTYDTSLETLKETCNGFADSNTECFYENNDVISSMEYHYETSSVSVCGTGGTIETGIWDKTTEWDTSLPGKWNTGIDRNCSADASADSVNESLYTDFDYLWDYYPATEYTGSCGTGLVASGRVYADDEGVPYEPPRKCKYCGVDTVTGMTYLAEMHTFYIDDKDTPDPVDDQVNCAFPAPPILDDSSCPTGTATGIAWGIPSDPSFEDIGSTETYWWWCLESETPISTKYIVPYNEDEPPNLPYACLTGIYNCQTPTLETDDKVYCGVEDGGIFPIVIDAGSLLSQAEAFVDKAGADLNHAGGKVVCGSDGNVKGWKIKTYPPE